MARQLSQQMAVVVILVAVSALPVGASRQCTVTPHASWKSSLDEPGDPFFHHDSSTGISWVKLTILACDPQTVYFQDSRTYPFHSDFIRDRLDPYLGIDRAELDRLSLRAEGQEIFLGAVLRPSQGLVGEYGIQLIRADPYEPEEVRQLFARISGAVHSDEPPRFFYFPTYEQGEISDADRQLLASWGILVSSPDRWVPGDACCYAHGWALGILRFVTSDAIASAYRNGDLLPGDILLTDGVPAEVPILAGITTLTPSSPSSHVAILAKTFGVPFAYLADSSLAEDALALAGRRVVLRAEEEHGICSVRLIDAGLLDQQQVSEVLALKEPPPLAIVPIAPYGALAAPSDGLAPADIRYFGGKAANFGFLRRALPDGSPVAGAISFDLWCAFLDQTLSPGHALRQEIAGRLATHSYPPDMRALSTDLEAIRQLLRDDQATLFTAQQRQAVIGFLQDPAYGFDAGRRIRFRSSTNVEDSEQFTGAGLYDSYSGCLADDLDDDDAGPSHCDPARDSERGVFDAIRRVFASFYNDNAYLERLRYRIDENDVGMALLVHHSFPDEIELANGVATVEVHEDSWRSTITLVSQAGAISVANPEDGSIPEIVELPATAEPGSATLRQRSNRVLLGETVLGWDWEYRDLGAMLMAVAEAFAAHTGKLDYLLDLEYKKVAPDGTLVVKQVREVPLPDATPSITPFLINEPVDLCTVQGPSSGSDVFANHRLKARWHLATGSCWLDESNLAERFFTGVAGSQVHSCRLDQLAGDPSSLPAASYRFESAERTAIASWTRTDLANPRTYELRTSRITDLVAPSASPVLSLRDWDTSLRAAYRLPVSSVDWTGQPTTTTTDEVRLTPCYDDAASIASRLEIEVGGVSITSSYELAESLTPWWGLDLARFRTTIIEGLTSEPIVLTGYYSQTYDAGHHNQPEEFIFDPWLDAGVPQHLLQELRDQGVRLLYVHVRHDFEGDQEELRLYADEDGCWSQPVPRHPTSRR